MQMLLLFVVIMTSLALLVASHRIGHRPFMLVTGLVAVIAAIILAALVFAPGRGVAPMATDQLSLTLKSVNATESGYRVDGMLHNQSDEPLAETNMLFTRQCPDSDCDASARFTLLLHVPAGRSYPFSQVVNIKPESLQDPRWTLTIEAARAYRQDH